MRVLSLAAAVTALGTMGTGTCCCTYILLDPMGRVVSWEGGGQPTLRGPKLGDTLERPLPVR